MTAKAAKASRASTPAVGVRPEFAGPHVSWALLAREFVVDRGSGTRSAFNIVEDIVVPLSAIRSGNMRVVALDEPLTFAFTLDWRWPAETDAPALLRLDWHAPGGDEFRTVGGDMAQAVNRPAQGARTTIHLRIADLPIEAEGVYHFDVVVNDTVAARYPVRVRASVKDPIAPLEKPRARRATKTARKASG